MTVKELIEELQKLPQDIPVTSSDDGISYDVKVYFYDGMWVWDDQCVKSGRWLLPRFDPTQREVVL